MGKGGNTTTTTNSYDPAASEKMAEIAGKQEAMAEDQWNEYKQYFQDYDVAAVNANKQLLPYATSSTQAQLQEQELASNENAKLLPAYTNQALTGVDVNKRADEAGNEVKANMKLGEMTRRREASQYGIDPNSTAFGTAVNNAALDTSRAVAGARTGAKNAAEEENFARLGAALGKQSGAVTTVSNANPEATAAQSYSGAAATYAPLATRVLSSEKDTSGGGFADLLGKAAGIGAGALGGNYLGTLGTKWAQ
ncbi:MAG: hypothetical protein ABSG75_06065 [Syntrophales bacterium]|jgi:hypothetical protein